MIHMQSLIDATCFESVRVSLANLPDEAYEHIGDHLEAVMHGIAAPDLSFFQGHRIACDPRKRL